MLAGVVPATMVYYAAYETSKKLVPEELGALKGMTVGLMTQLAAGLAFTPVDIVKERMQVRPFASENAYNEMNLKERHVLPNITIVIVEAVKERLQVRPFATEVSHIELKLMAWHVLPNLTIANSF